MSKYYDLLAPAERSGFRRKQIALMRLKEGEKVLDAGCGTGSLSILAKLAVGDAGQVCGIDIAPKMIAQAEKKAGKYGLDIDFRAASIANLPFPDERFDAVISSLVFHHLPVHVKKEALEEVYRVLKRDGRFILADFCTPGFISAPLMFLFLIWLNSTRSQLFGKLPALIRESGFKSIKLAVKGFFLKYYLIEK